MNIHTYKYMDIHCKENYEIPGFFYQTFLGLCKLIPARESLGSDILAGDWNIAKPFSYSEHPPADGLSV